MVFINTFFSVIVQFEKVGFGSAKSINSMNDAMDPYELKVDSMGKTVILNCLRSQCLVSSLDTPSMEEGQFCLVKVKLE